MEQYRRSLPSTRTTELQQLQRYLLPLHRGQSVFLDPFDPLAVSIMVEFEKLLYIPDLKMLLIFLVSKVFEKGIIYVQNEFMLHSHMRFYLRLCSATRCYGSLSVYRGC